MRSPSWPAVLLVPVLALLAPSPVAALYKCTTAGGSVSFQQMPCSRGNGVELEAGDAFGVRPAVPRPAAETPANAQPADGRTAATAGVTPTGQTIHVGPRGGRYTLTKSGRKAYLPKPAADAGTPAPNPAPATSDIHMGPRGGCYTLGSTGRKNYLPREHCPAE